MYRKDRYMPKPVHARLRALSHSDGVSSPYSLLATNNFCAVPKKSTSNFKSLGRKQNPEPTSKVEVAAGKKDRVFGDMLSSSEAYNLETRYPMQKCVFPKVAGTWPGNFLSVA